MIYCKCRGLDVSLRFCICQVSSFYHHLKVCFSIVVSLIFSPPRVWETAKVGHTFLSDICFSIRITVNKETHLFSIVFYIHTPDLLKLQLGIARLCRVKLFTVPERWLWRFEEGCFLVNTSLAGILEVLWTPCRSSFLFWWWMGFGGAHRQLRSVMEGVTGSLEM